MKMAVTAVSFLSPVNANESQRGALASSPQEFLIIGGRNSRDVKDHFVGTVQDQSLDLGLHDVLRSQRKNAPSVRTAQWTHTPSGVPTSNFRDP